VGLWPGSRVCRPRRGRFTLPDSIDAPNPLIADLFEQG